MQRTPWGARVDSPASARAPECRPHAVGTRRPRSTADEFGRCASSTCTTDSDCDGTLCRGTRAVCEGPSYACEGPTDAGESDLDCWGDLCTLENGTCVCGAL